MIIAVLLFWAVASPPPSFESLSASAEKARAAGKLDEAIALYRKSIDLHPGWRDGWWALGSIYYQKDEYAECTDACRKLTALDTTSGPAYGMLGLCELGTNDYAAALRDMEAGRKRGALPREIDRVVGYSMVEAHTKLGEFEQALTLLSERARNVEEDTTLVTLCGIAALRRPALPQEIPASDRELVYLAGNAFWNALAHKEPAAQAGFQTLLNKYPEAEGVHYLYGSFLLNSNPDGALVEFEKEVKLHPNHVPALAAAAAEYLRREEAPKGLAFAERAAKLMPDGAGPHALLGRLLEHTGDLKRALGELQTAIRLAPEDPQPRLAIASVYSRMGMYDQAGRERKEFVRLKKLQESGASQE